MELFNNEFKFNNNKLNNELNNELKSQDTWNVVKTYLHQYNDKQLIRHQLDSFDSFIENDIKKIIEENNPIKVTKSFVNEDKYPLIEYEIYIEDPNISIPVIVEHNGCVKHLYPHEAKIRNLTYSFPLSGNIKQIIKYYNKNNEIINTTKILSKNVIIGNIPIMLHSKYCTLSQEKNDIAKLHECKYDKGGYFIINGNDKVIILQERMCDNKAYVFKIKQSKLSYVCEIRSNQDMTKLSQLLQIKFLSKDGITGKCTIKIKFPHLRDDIPLFILFKAFGFETDKDIISLIMGSEIDEEYIELLKPSIIDSINIRTKEKALEYIRKHLTIKINDINELFMREILPHVGNSLKKKSFFLGYMTRQLLDFLLNKRKLSDRDHYANKRVELPGILLAQIFRRLYAKMLRDFKSSIYKEITTNCEINVTKLIKSSIIENGLKYALATGNWNVKVGIDNKRVGVAQVLNRLTYSSTLSHLRRLNTPIDRSGKLIKPRQLHNTHHNAVCPVETPEGGSVGIVKNLALTCNITLDSSIEPILQILKDYDMIDLENIDPNELNINKTTKIFLNGDWIGIHYKPNIIIEHIKELRRRGELDNEISIIFKINDNEIRINTDSGRCIRPLYIVKNNKLLIKQKHIKLIKDGIYEWKHLIRDGLIEYIDVEESESCMIAMKFKDLTDNPEIQYTHCEIHPSLMLGICASMIPFPDHNQSPRNTYQSAMGKQSMGINTTNFLERMDTFTHLLHYPQKPIVSTKAAELLHFNDFPAGQNIIVAIACFTGYNQEDSLIMNQSAIDRGLFNSTFYRTYKAEERKNMSAMAEEKFCNPDKNNCIGIKHGSYHNLDDNGIIKVGTYVKGNDIIIGKITPVITQPFNNKKKFTYKDTSISLRSNEEGIVDSIVLTTNQDGYKFTKVRVRSIRIPEIGDKFSSRHGQKGTVGMTYREEDMPFTEDGITPDIIINPHCIPSRMTVAQLIECMLSKIGCTNGEFLDGTPFEDFNVEDICNLLENIGYDRKGKQVMYNGQTGEKFNAHIFIGPTFYQRLKHMVQDKVHSRSKGPVQNLTRQPVEGRSRDGGLRLGEMEVDCLLSHGVSAFLKERTFECSDKYYVYICDICGLLATVNTDKDIYNCSVCNNTTKFSKISLPYATKLLWLELCSMGIFPRFITKS